MLDKAKKIVLSVSVIVLFALYAVREKERAPLHPPAVVAGPAVTRTATSSSVAPTVTPAASHPVATATATTPPQPTDSILTPTVPTATAQSAAEAHSTTNTSTSSGAYRDGTYTGSVADANWGNVEVQAVITNGRISDVQFLEYPNHRNRSQMINEQAMPQLTQEAITSQQAKVDIVTGATDTSEAFIESLGAALKQASA